MIIASAVYIQTVNPDQTAYKENSLNWVHSVLHVTCGADILCNL